MLLRDFGRRGALPLFVSFTALSCAEGEDPPTGPTTAAGTTSTTTGTTSTTGSGGAGTGGSASTTSGSGGAGGGATVTNGTGGSGGATGSGGGGVGGGAATGAIVAVVGHGAAVAEGARFVPGTGWTDYASLGASAKSAALVPISTGAVAVLRHDGTTGFANDEVLFSEWAGGSGFGATAAVGVSGLTSGLPALAPIGSSSLLVFLGTDSKHYFSQYDGAVWSAFGQVPAGTVGVQAFGPSAASVASTASGDVVVYAGGDANLYFATKPSAAAAFGLSAQAGTIGGLSNALSPVAVVDAAGDLNVFYVRGADARICRTVLDLPGSTWSAEQVVNTNALTDRSPAAVLTPSGEVFVAWHAFNGNDLFVSKGTTTFSTPVAAATPASASTGPVLTISPDGTTDAELLYVSGSKLFHLRMTGGTSTGGEVPGLTSVQTVAATTVP